jgi:hypothetical protein
MARLRSTALLAASGLRVGLRLPVTAMILACAWGVMGARATAVASNCEVTSVGFIPLNDLGNGAYHGEEGGLYPGGGNERPAAHDAAGRSLAEEITPIRERIVLISIGMSNTTQEFSRFVPMAMNFPGRNPALLVVDCAAGGQHAAIAADPNSPYWNTVRQRLMQAGVDSTQVRAAWVKEAIPGPTLPFPNDALELKGYFRAIAMNLTDKFPNLKIAYYSTRIYAGYAQGVSQLNPEPWAYQSGFEDQIEGTDPGLNYDPEAGPVEAPWLAWGPYLWADGLIPRSDGLIWECSDFQNDGTHPSISGRDKVAGMLLDFFTTDLTTTPWFLATGSGIGSDSGAPAARNLTLLPARPNPMLAATWIPVAGGVAGPTLLVRVAVYDPSGRLVRVLHRGPLDSGAHVMWDGANESGAAVPAGTYFVRAGGAEGGVGSSVKVTVTR